ncbi:hypothetical protein KFE25_001781 [Diacronema lutheri]|uniref:Uncharacterized protein n=1 Tax=Diacronema lutheri TaxID=2081491 RepID=A0A8J5XAN5_DIALT|nr:hypothetical protein KFE25_001781 [Diacronema lutheri]
MAVALPRRVGRSASESDVGRKTLPASPRPRDRWKRTRRTFYVAVVASLLGMSTTVGRLHSHEAQIAQQQALMDVQVRESRRWLVRMVIVETGLLVLNSYGMYRGVKFALLLKQIRLRLWIDSIRARMPFVRATARVLRIGGGVLKTSAWPLTFPISQLAHGYRRRRALRAASLARRQVSSVRTAVASSAAVARRYAG